MLEDGIYDWNGRPVRISDGKVEDYVGDGVWKPSRLTVSRISKPGGDLSHFDDEAELTRSMASVDRGDYFRSNG